MDHYEQQALRELQQWQIRMNKKPSLFNGLTKGLQNKVNNVIPDKIHEIMTSAIKNIVRAALLGSEFTTKKEVPSGLSLAERERLVRERLRFYKKAAATEGAATGAGGLFLGLADFPLLLTLKMKFLFEVAAIYGFDIKDYRERLYILHLFQLAFSSDARRREVYQKVLNWEATILEFPSLQAIDWRRFQQEYRDYIDLVKLLQLVPVVGAFIGAYANYHLLDNLGDTAMNGYRLRFLQQITITPK
ncbi:EcsC family protein [Desulforamulus aeronauticus]|uniref:EcsC protein family protein n=1 Tax=Desulforamulus aeronauticus DSM 10349 TaxID=1121421 RepID=A0A1M6W570_9FIRM|nr:EcsC family protein [Desulforamulus aeronauticus]SHK88904.1 EcsC protein family protein [Desulforamulus aeronauticus DSM 10349]